jgi:hypothetical protein
MKLYGERGQVQVIWYGSDDTENNKETKGGELCTVILVEVIVAMMISESIHDVYLLSV